MRGMRCGKRHSRRRLLSRTHGVAWHRGCTPIILLIDYTPPHTPPHTRTHLQQPPLAVARGAVGGGKQRRERQVHLRGERGGLRG